MDQWIWIKSQEKDPQIHKHFIYNKGDIVDQLGKLDHSVNDAGKSVIHMGEKIKLDPYLTPYILKNFPMY